MTLPLAVAGTVHRDDITTPSGRAESLGGSAVYFALAASRCAPVLLNGVVGADAVDDVRAALTGCDVDLEGLVAAPEPTFLWRAEHDFEHWVTVSEESREGADPTWSALLPRPSADAPLLFVASMRPEKQKAIVDQSRARVIGVDTMNVYVRSEPAALAAVLSACDIVFVNHAELAGLTTERDWRRQAQSLLGRGRIRVVVVKHGPLGAAVVARKDVIELPAHPVDRVVDPTGAGDALAGGFLGYCARVERDDDDVYAAALATGLECAAHTITTFGTDGLRRFVTGAADDSAPG